jgi:hypothetical protein
MSLLADSCRQWLTGWQEDDHVMVVDYSPTGLLDATPLCPGVSQWRPWCLIPWEEGGLHLSGRDVHACALDDLWEDPLEWADSTVDLSKLTPGVWPVRWQICPSRHLPAWEPLALLNAGQVAA